MPWWNTQGHAEVRQGQPEPRGQAQRGSAVLFQQRRLPWCSWDRHHSRAPVHGELSPVTGGETQAQKRKYSPNLGTPPPQFLGSPDKLPACPASPGSREGSLEEARAFPMLPDPWALPCSHSGPQDFVHLVCEQRPLPPLLTDQVQRPEGCGPDSARRLNWGCNSYYL
jgi:hypothetical protein